MADLVALGREHYSVGGEWCIRCRDVWPCVTRKLADALEQSQERVRDLEAAVRRFFDAERDAGGSYFEWRLDGNPIDAMLLDESDKAKDALCALLPDDQEGANADG